MRKNVRHALIGERQRLVGYCEAVHVRVGLNEMVSAQTALGMDVLDCSHRTFSKEMQYVCRHIHGKPWPASVMIVKVSQLCNMLTT